MKYLKLPLILLLFTCVVFSCKKDDDGDDAPVEKTTAELIVGTWRWTSSQLDGEDVPLTECDLMDTLTIEASTLSTTSFSSTDGSAPCEADTFGPIPYTISENTVTFTVDGESGVFNIESVNDTTLVILDEDEGEIFRDTYTRQ